MKTLAIVHTTNTRMKQRQTATITTRVVISDRIRYSRWRTDGRVNRKWVPRHRRCRVHKRKEEAANSPRCQPEEEDEEGEALF